MYIEHVSIYVMDLESAKEFFIKYFDGRSNDGYYNFSTGFKSYFISFEKGPRIELMNRPDMSDPDKVLFRTGYSHIAFSVGSKEKVDSITEQLKRDGYEVISGPRITGDGYYESCVIVFEGNQIEITV